MSIKSLLEAINNLSSLVKELIKLFTKTLGEKTLAASKKIRKMADDFKKTGRPKW